MDAGIPSGAANTLGMAQEWRFPCSLIVAHTPLHVAPSDPMLNAFVAVAAILSWYLPVDMMMDVAGFAVNNVSTNIFLNELPMIVFGNALILMGRMAVGYGWADMVRWAMEPSQKRPPPVKPLLLTDCLGNFVVAQSLTGFSCATTVITLPA